MNRRKQPNLAEPSSVRLTIQVTADGALFLLPNESNNP